jgi:hypothetical protein
MLMKPSPGIAVGSIDVEAWKQTEKIMVEQGVIPGHVSVERILKPPDKGFSEGLLSYNKP